MKKANVQDYNLGLNFIAALRPVSYIYTNGDQGLAYNAFIAQRRSSVKSLNKMGIHFSGLCTPQNDMTTYSLRYDNFVVPLVNAVKELNDKNQELQQQLDKQMGMIKELEAKMQQLQSATTK